MPVPKLLTPRKRSRASAYAATVPMTTEIPVARMVTIRLFLVHVRNSVSQSSLL